MPMASPRRRTTKLSSCMRVSPTTRARSLAARMAPAIDATYRRIEALIGEEFSAQFGGRC